MLSIFLLKENIVKMINSLGGGTSYFELKKSVRNVISALWKYHTLCLDVLSHSHMVKQKNPAILRLISVCLYQENEE